MSLLVVGTLAFDSVETPFGHRDATLGGSASFLATAASYFHPVSMVGIVGKDFPEEHLDFFRSRGINTDGVARSTGRTFRWRGRYDYDLNVRHTLETQLNVLDGFNPSLPPAYREAKYVVLGNFDPAIQLAVLDQVREPVFVACDTMNFWIESHPAALRKTLARVHLLSVNDSEARQLSGEFNLVQAARVIRAMGPKSVIIKRGEHGAVLFTDEGIFAAPAFPLEVIVDPTGAGDTFAGGMMGFLAKQDGKLNGASLRQAVIMGSVLASFVVEDYSLDRLRTLTDDEIRLRFFEFKNLTHFEADTAWGAVQAS